MAKPRGVKRTAVVFLLDVDNTLLDNDRIAAGLRRHLTTALGRRGQARYWKIFEEHRSRIGYADYLGALERYRIENPHEPHFLAITSFLMDYPFADALLPGALAVVRRLGRWGTTVILTDGDAVFQPLKVERAGLFEAVQGRVLVYIHKEKELRDVERRYPARRYVVVDDKLRILTAVKRKWGSQVTTVFPRQGHYARDPKILASFPPADVTIERIGDLLRYDRRALLRDPKNK